MLTELKGYLLAGIAAAAYGTNPAFAVPLYECGMNPNTVLLFRYVMGLPILAAIMWVRGVRFNIQKETLGLTVILGILMAFSSLTLFESYQYMNSGVASTLLFVYPVMVAVMMIFFFHEKFRVSVFLCLAIMFGGIVLMMKPGDLDEVSVFGCLLVMISALTYAIYIVLVNISKKISAVPTTKLLFYVLSWGSLVFLAMIPAGNALTLPSISFEWINLLALALIPTIVSLACTTRAIQLIGSTPTAILGSLEPVAAVVLSVTVLNQGISGNEIAGGLMIVAATTIVIGSKQVDNAILHVKKMFPKKKV